MPGPLQTEEIAEPLEMPTNPSDQPFFPNVKNINNMDNLRETSNPKDTQTKKKLKKKKLKKKSSHKKKKKRIHTVDEEGKSSSKRRKKTLKGKMSKTGNILTKSLIFAYMLPKFTGIFQ